MQLLIKSNSIKCVRPLVTANTIEPTGKKTVVEISGSSEVVWSLVSFWQNLSGPLGMMGRCKTGFASEISLVSHVLMYTQESSQMVIADYTIAIQR